MRLENNDILAMAILYQDDLPEGQELELQVLAAELLARAIEAGMATVAILTENTVFRAQRVEDAALVTAPDAAGETITAMLRDALQEVRNRMAASPEGVMPMVLKMTTFRTVSTIVGAARVGLYIYVVR